MRRSVNAYWEPEQPVTPREGESYYCPVCGDENPPRYFRDALGRIVGCDHCIEEIDAAEWEADHRA